MTKSIKQRNLLLLKTDVFPNFYLQEIFLKLPLSQIDEIFNCFNVNPFHNVENYKRSINPLEILFTKVVVYKGLQHFIDEDPDTAQFIRTTANNMMTKYDKLCEEINNQTKTTYLECMESGYFNNDLTIKQDAIHDIEHIIKSRITDIEPHQNIDHYVNHDQKQNYFYVRISTAIMAIYLLQKNSASSQNDSNMEISSENVTSSTQSPNKRKALQLSTNIPVELVTDAQTCDYIPSTTLADEMDEHKRNGPDLNLYFNEQLGNLNQTQKEVAKVLLKPRFKNPNQPALTVNLQKINPYEYLKIKWDLYAEGYNPNSAFIARTDIDALMNILEEEKNWLYDPVNQAKEAAIVQKILIRIYDTKFSQLLPKDKLKTAVTDITGEENITSDKILIAGIPNSVIHKGELAKLVAEVTKTLELTVEARNVLSLNSIVTAVPIPCPTSVKNGMISTDVQMLFLELQTPVNWKQASQIITTKETYTVAIAQQGRQVKSIISLGINLLPLNVTKNDFFQHEVRGVIRGTAKEEAPLINPFIKSCIQTELPDIILHVIIIPIHTVFNFSHNLDSSMSRGNDTIPYHVILTPKLPTLESEKVKSILGLTRADSCNLVTIQHRPLEIRRDIISGLRTGYHKSVFETSECSIIHGCINITSKQVLNAIGIHQHEYIAYIQVVPLNKTRATIYVVWKPSTTTFYFLDVTNFSRYQNVDGTPLNVQNHRFGTPFILDKSNAYKAIQKYTFFSLSQDLYQHNVTWPDNETIAPKPTKAAPVPTTNNDGYTKVQSKAKRK